MATPVSVVYTSSWNIQGAVSQSKISAWNVGGPPVQQNMVQAAAVPWISTYPS